MNGHHHQEYLREIGVGCYLHLPAINDDDRETGESFDDEVLAMDEGIVRMEIMAEDWESVQ